MVRLILLGPPGAGKGTQAAFLHKLFNIPVISTGNILRSATQEGSALGLQAQVYMDRGDLVPDDVVIGLVAAHVAKPVYVGGYLFDGFPRTVAQAQAMVERNIQVDVVCFLDVADEHIVKRMAGRRVHVASGRVYHVDVNPPKVAGCDDLTSEPLVMRDDDQPDVVLQRLQVYRQKTEPVVDFYRQKSQEKGSMMLYYEIDGGQDLLSVQAQLKSVITPFCQ